MLSRLTFNVTQACNLRCIYCYALGGSYGGPSLRMQPNVAVSRLKDVAKRHSIIQSIQFIGGEPLLNVPTIRAVGEATIELVKNGAIAKRPNFSVVTNLTILPESTLNTLKEFDIQVVASLDGPAEIHDKLRLTASNKPTHSTIVDNLDRLISANIPFEIEATYTRLHLEHCFSMVDLLHYFAQWSPKKIHISAVMTEASHETGFYTDSSWQSVIDLETEALDYVIDELGRGNYVSYGLFAEILSMLMVNDNDLFCPAGASNLAISADGAYYACHMFTNNQRYNIPDELPVLTQKSNHLVPRKEDFSQCRSCWARKWCRVCVGRMETFFPGNPQPLLEQCKRTRRTLELVMQRLPNVLRHTP